MLIGTYTILMIMIKRKVKLLIIAVILQSCALSPGMHMDRSEIYIDSLDTTINIETISNYLENKSDNSLASIYRIGNGDQISITVWGFPEIFPLTNISADQNLRRVDSNGNIYFPYVGLIKARGKTQNELRNDISRALSNFFNDPQLDVSIARFNSQRIYLLGEITDPTKINLTDIPLSLSDALGQARGLNTNTSDGSEVFIIRQGIDKLKPRIYRADLSSPAGFLEASNFYMQDRDIIYVNAKGTTRWNRVISQFFPFSSFLNSIDNLSSSD